MPLTMAVSFALMCAFSVWERRTRDQVPGVRAPPARLNVGLAQENRLPAVEPATSAPTAQPSAPAPRMAAEAQRMVSQAAPADYAKLDLPIQFNYRRAPGTQAYVVTLINKTEQAMTLEVTVFNPISQRTAETQVSIEPMQAKRIDAGDDLEMEPGDRITLHNSSYNDLVEEIRER